MAKQKSEQRKAAELYAKQSNVKVKSAMRQIQRIVKGDVKKPKTEKLSSYAKKKISKVVSEKRAEKIKREKPVERREAPARESYSRSVKTGAAISCPDAPNPFRNLPSRAQVVTILATYQISNDRTHRKINLYCAAADVERIKNAGSLFDAIAQWTNSECQPGYDAKFLQGANISEVEI